jgi:hypothetical protein
MQGFKYAFEVAVFKDASEECVARILLTQCENCFNVGCKFFCSEAIYEFGFVLGWVGWSQPTALNLCFTAWSHSSGSLVEAVDKAVGGQ